IMTEKDAVKCSHYAQDNWWYLPVSAQFESNDAEQILNRIKEVKAAYGSPST
ncbi:tetraacyldisaccharide 4'-kinase, partial [Vibrio parahaemolyticus]|nr:tetraacyldisaccharide 4'-kinase [Vibrio parahaemolyticus]